MLMTVAFYVAIGIFGIGLLYKVSTWFRCTVGGAQANEISALERVGAALRGIISTVFSPRILTLLKVFLLDVLLQVKISKESTLRWVMHMTIFWGFVLLLLMHALDDYLTAVFFTDYASTLNPFLFLRNLFAFAVIVGIAIAAFRRWLLKAPRFMSSAMDHYLLILLSVILISGVFLEGMKIISHKRYKAMVEDYADVSDEESLRSLEGYWVKEFGVVSPDLQGPFDEAQLENGKEIHEMSCAACHSKPQWAFLSYGVAQSLRPFAGKIDGAGIPDALLYVHFLACFIGLAYLPFSKMFHMFASPLSLLANAVMDTEKSNPANILTRQVMELDACMHCGSCTSRCSVAVCFEEIHNVRILPSEKIAPLKALARGKRLAEDQLRTLQAGLYLCTNCHHCTDACPAGINLQELWFNAREALLEKGQAEVLTLSPLSFYRGLRREDLVPDQYARPAVKVKEVIEQKCRSFEMYGDVLEIKTLNVDFKKRLRLSNQSNTFSYCFTCMTCSTACPVVANYKDPKEVLGLMPHQIIHSAILGFSEPIYRSNMLWNCLGCYQCQESCPQGVQVTDILYELKNMGIEHMNGKRSKSEIGEAL
ncbi:MAG: 4Fe-4S dicluster domain-containing protein [Desulfobacterales bacterium]|nr:4Fe-4S dicluster domain-containing protein [Desulfobacterales bacterium]